MRLWPVVVVALQLRCVALLAIPRGGRGGGAAGRRAAGGEHLDPLLQLRGPAAAAPHKKAPQFMLDLFNAVSVADGTPRSQKDILQGNVVRSFEDKGEDVQILKKTATAFYAWDSVVFVRSLEKIYSLGSSVIFCPLRGNMLIAMRKSYPRAQLRTAMCMCSTGNREDFSLRTYHLQRCN